MLGVLVCGPHTRLSSSPSSPSSPLSSSSLCLALVVQKKQPPQSLGRVVWFLFALFHCRSSQQRSCPSAGLSTSLSCLPIVCVSQVCVLLLCMCVGWVWFDLVGRKRRRGRSRRPKWGRGLVQKTGAQKWRAFCGLKNVVVCVECGKNAAAVFVFSFCCCCCWGLLLSSLICHASQQNWRAVINAVIVFVVPVALPLCASSCLLHPGARVRARAMKRKKAADVASKG